MSLGECVTFTNPEPDLRSRLTSLPPEADSLVVPDFGNKCLFRRRRRDNRVSGTRRSLMWLRLDGLLSTEQFIPEAYRLAPAAARLELLSGPIGTEETGLRSGRTVRGTTSSPALADGVAFLARSLGAVASEGRGVP